MVLPSGFAAPPIEYTFVLASATILVTAFVFAVDPPIEQRVVLGLLPWMGLGGALHAFHQIGLYPEVAAPFFGAPAVYFTTYVIVGVVWGLIATFALIRAHATRISRDLGFVGLFVLLVVVGYAGYRAGSVGTFSPVWPAVAVVVALLNTVFVGTAIALWETPAFVRTRYAGPAVVFAHALDGVTTAIGRDVLGVTERSPLPRAIMDGATQLPMTETIGVGWVFLLVKLAVAAVVVIAFADYVEEEPARSSLVLTFVAAVGLGPATNNLVLFLVGLS